MRRVLLRISMGALLPLCAMSLQAQAAPAATVVPTIPAIPGLVVTAAKTGDHYRGKPVDTEIITAVESVDEISQHLMVHFSYFSQSGNAATVSEESFKRQNLLDDLKISQRLGDVYFSVPDTQPRAGNPLVIQSGPMAENSPGMTYMITSARVLAKLKTRGKSLFLLLDSEAGERQPMNIVSDHMIDRVGTTDELLPTLVNGKPALLPTIHAHGDWSDRGKSSAIDLWFLDDPANVLVIKAIVRVQGDPIPAINQVVRIDYPLANAQAIAALSQDLSAGGCRAELHGVYFNTASANLLPESDPTLRQVAAVLKLHKDWTLAVEGHTDAQGADAYNLDLSKRRATAVRDALVKRLGIAATQLTVTGYGKTHPVDSNDTLIGRSHNRRVELARACGKP